jgi:RNA polymerase sigma-70 factor (ECF subfamily)
LVSAFQPGEVESGNTRPWFDDFVAEHGARLRRALVAANGVQVGNDACADALAWGWEYRDRLAGMTHPVAYLFRVGQSSARRQRRWRDEIALPPERVIQDAPVSSPRLDVALTRLSDRQRTVVILVHAHGWTYAEVADAMGMSVAAVRNRLHRGMKQLRVEMKVP